LVRKASVVSLEITPVITEREDIFGNVVKAPVLGIASQVQAYQEMHIGSALVGAGSETWFIATATLKALGQIVTGQRGVDELSGPLRIAKYSGQSVDKGMSTVLWFMVVLSVNLGLINLFPIPMLDGGHLLYYSIEAVRGKPMADQIQEWGLRVGLALILCLAVFSTVNDLRHLNVF
jgi:regulator of sigma E protease